MRLHGIGEREPWAFGDEAEAIARKWLAFRYRLLPYLQRVIAEATAHRDAGDARDAARLSRQRAHARRTKRSSCAAMRLLVAPIIAAGGEVDVALPPGAWYDLNSRQRVAGGRVVRYKATLDRFPVFGREGYALPLGRAVQHTGEIERRASARAALGVRQADAAARRVRAGRDQRRRGRARSRSHAAEGVKVERFGDAAGVSVLPLDVRE